ncbi:MAG: hypothetical protein WBH36_10520 [Syntrophobacteria bacterium]
MVEISEYNQQQKEALLMVRQHLSGLPLSQLHRLKQRIRSYVGFRQTVASFQKTHFSDLCSEKCFTSYTSACCGREGIITFFADVVVNVLLSTQEEIDVLLDILDTDTGGLNCVYLNKTGCLWRAKPIVCEMFLCKHAKNLVLENNKALKSQWETFRQRERRYTWPTRPVLFDELEDYFIGAGFDSPLMYLHRSPGLLRLKAKHALGRKQSLKVRHV